MRGYWQRLERARDPINVARDHLDKLVSLFGLSANHARRGFDDWLTTTMADPKLLLENRKLARITIEAIEQTNEEKIGNILLRLLRGMDPNDWRILKNRASGVARTPLCVRDGHRNGPREYLRRTQEEHGDKLEIRSNVLVCRILFDSDSLADGQPAACGVEDAQGKDLAQI